MLIYKVVGSKTGFKELEKEVTRLLNKGWKPIGSISFNQGYCYQAMVGKTTKGTMSHPTEDDSKETCGAIDAMKRIDQLT